MRITRRHFLGVSTGAAANLFSLHPAAMGGSGNLSGGQPGCVLLDLKSQCALGESLLGYKKILGGVCVVSAEALPQAISPGATVIVPGAGIMDTELAQMLGEMLQRGRVLLLESGGGFLNPDEFFAHQQMLRRHWSVLAERPVNLWASVIERGAYPRAEPQARHKAAGNGPVPYIDYIWPHKIKVRDFTHVVPLAAQEGDVIGFAGRFPVALRRRVGKGTLIFLGSPIGPHLLAGDRDAGRWLHSVLAA